MKKILIIALSLTLILTGLIGCGSKPEVTSSLTSSSIESTAVASSSEENSQELSSDASVSEISSMVVSESNVLSTSTVKSSVVTSSVAGMSSSKSSSKSSSVVSRQAPTGKTYQPVASSLSGTISFSGSTSVYPVAAALTEAFKKKYPRVKITITNVTGSGAGLADAKAGTVSFGMRSSSWTGSSDATKNPNIKFFQIAMDGVAIVVNKGNALTDITFAQIKSVYENTGTPLSGITNPVSRESGSGTKTCFDDIMKSMTSAMVYPASYGQIATSTDAVETNVSNNANSIGYMSLGAVNSTVKKITVEGVEATNENVVNGTYKFSRPFLLLRKSDKLMNAAEKEFIKFALSLDGQKIIDNSHYISITQDQITAELAKIN